MGRSMTLPLILLGAGAIGCVVAAISLWRQAQRSAERPLPVAIVVGSSLAETLHGETAVGRCPACGSPLRFAVESLPRVGDVLCPNCGEPVDPDRLEQRQADRVAVVSLAEVERPSVGLLYVFAAPEGEGATPVVKRVVAHPLWRVAIEGGDLYLDENLVRKSPHDETFPRVLVHEERPAQDDRNATSFWKSESQPGNRVAHEFRPRTIWARENRPTEGGKSAPPRSRSCSVVAPPAYRQARVSLARDPRDDGEVAPDAPFHLHRRAFAAAADDLQIDVVGKVLAARHRQPARLTAAAEGQPVEAG